MKPYITVYRLALVFLFAVLSECAQAQQHPIPKDIPPIGRANTLKLIPSPGAHGGAGMLRSAPLLRGEDFGTDFLGMMTIVLEPGGSIGEHYFRNREEMYVILDGPARFGVNGRTAELPAGAMVPCTLKYSHGIYNYTDHPLHILLIAAGDKMATENGINNNNDLTGNQPETPPPFPWAQFDRNLMSPAESSHQGSGEILFRRLWNSGSFASKFYAFSHAVIPPGSSIGYHQHNTREEIYYVLGGRGRYTVNDSTFSVESGDALSCRLHDAHGIYNDSGAEMEILIFSVSRVKGAVTGEVDLGDDLTTR